VGGATKAPDYCFRIGGTRKFFVEAKKPSVNIAENIEPAYQLRRYAWSAKLPLSILTDFEEFAAYDCRIKPDKGDKASTARIMYLTQRDYPARWEEIAAVFSKDAVLRGSFDKYADTARLKKGTAGVDAAFLKEIETWREMLARNIALRNARLSQRELNAAVTLTINRIIFLRICEDRGVETYGQLMALKNGSDIYERLIRIYYAADDKYNSGLFHFRAERDRPASPDTLTLNLAIDDKTLKDIFGSLYYPDSPYEFSVLPADILGQVYEQFLGKIIHLTAGHRATVEDKPEVKKAGGVYYTPTYIVDYIVKNTVGKLLPSSDSNGDALPAKSRKAVTPKQATEIRILDPACGSGSFLLGAYQYLLDWHFGWYLDNDPGKWTKGKSPVLCQGPGGDWRLTTSERKRILLNNIYGVDIDAQAVEVTKLSLLLKVLEGENEQTLSNQLRLFRERALPDLGDNIKCGNSLIGPDFYDNQQTGFFDDEERYRINCFDWEKEFPEIFASKAPSPPAGEGRGEGGFDAVIGNPPYIRIQTMKEWAPLEVEFYKTAFAAAGKGNYDIYTVFVEKGLGLLNAKGRMGFILPHKFFNAQYGEPLRTLLAKGKHLSEVVHFGDQQVFSGATTYTCLLFLDKAGSGSCRFTRVEDLDAWQKTRQGTEGTIPDASITAAEWNFTIGRDAALFEKLRRMPVKLGDVARIFQGLVTGADKVFVFEEIAPQENGLILVRDYSGAEWLLEAELLKPFISHITVSSYERPYTRHRLIFPYTSGKTQLTNKDIMAACYPKIWAYLQQNGGFLRDREGGKWHHDQWYAFGRTQNMTEMDAPKLIVQVISREGRYAYDEDSIYFTGGGNGPYYGIRWRLPDKLVSLFYLQGLLNAKLLDYYLRKISSPFRGGYWSYGKRFIEQLPIRTIDFADPADKARHDRMVALVEQMLSLHRKLAEAKTDHEKTTLQRQIDATDRQIDRLVYELYELTDEEIRIVEGAH
ncbi:MAG: restriction endonuclease subunit M, partial [Syntrophus sp. (in: bacteria)]|nr:restriction endonuclease subunit M [Syntrophus sp. (in: bacteria)]